MASAGPPSSSGHQKSKVAVEHDCDDDQSSTSSEATQVGVKGIEVIS